MKLEQQVCSLELAKKLKELGVKQESQFYWRLGYSTSESFDKGVSMGKQGHFRDYEIIHNPKPRYTTADVKWNESDLRKLYETEYSAFTVAELGEMLPEYANVNGMQSWFSDKEKGKWRCSFRYNINTVQTADTEANARAKMLIYLLENHLIGE